MIALTKLRDRNHQKCPKGTTARILQGIYTVLPKSSKTPQKLDRSQVNTNLGYCTLRMVYGRLLLLECRLYGLT